MKPSRHGRSDLAVPLIALVLLLAFTFPGYALANRVEPILLGLPFGMFWIAAWTVLGALALVVVYRRDARKDPEPRKDAEPRKDDG